MATGDKIYLDTDVVLDHLADRQPFSEFAHRLFALAEQEQGAWKKIMHRLSFAS